MGSLSCSQTSITHDASITKLQPERGVHQRNDSISRSINALEAVDHTEALPVSHARLEQIKRTNETDPVMETLAETSIVSGWPNDKK